MCVAMSTCVMLLALAGGALSALAPATLPRLATDKYHMKQSNKSLDFMREIREDLRRNNDDYVAAELRERQQRLSRNKGKLPKRVPPQHMDTRRALNATAASAANRTALAALAAGAGAPVARANGTHFRSNVQTLEYFKKLRIDKLKRLIDKGKSRLRNLMGPNASSPGDGVPRENDRTTHDHHTTHEGMPAGVPALSSEHENENRVPMRHHRGAPRQSPSPDQLDMAPARGVHVHMMRLQGRLCYRHLLNPEGPVYDHHGTSIIPEYAPEKSHGREFNATHRPNVVLPRCCNCCKKSVLGCQ